MKQYLNTIKKHCANHPEDRTLGHAVARTLNDATPQTVGYVGQTPVSRVSKPHRDFRVRGMRFSATGEVEYFRAPHGENYFNLLPAGTPVATVFATAALVPVAAPAVTTTGTQTTTVEATT